MPTDPLGGICEAVTFGAIHGELALLLCRVVHKRDLLPKSHSEGQLLVLISGNADVDESVVVLEDKLQVLFLYVLRDVAHVEAHHHLFLILP